MSSHHRSDPMVTAGCDRREFVLETSKICAALCLAPAVSCVTGAQPLFRISLAQWSLHRALRAGEIDALDFPRVARAHFGLEAVEHVNQFYADHGQELSYFRRLKAIADGEGVRSLLMMCDGEGALGDPDRVQRRQAVENHRRWLEAARILGCHSIRVNAESEPTHPPEEQQRLVADGLRELCDVASGYELDVLVENHGGLSSDGQWLAGLIEMVDHPRAGTLPDFGNFLLEADSAHPDGGRWYDRYRGVAELMPWARAVSAKSHRFDERGEETSTDFERMMRIVLDAGYRGWVGIEYEGDALGEADGILATKGLLERVRADLAPKYPAPAPSHG